VPLRGDIGAANTGTMVVFTDDRSQRLPHITFTPNNRAAALCSLGDGAASTPAPADPTTPDIMYNASYAAGPSVPEETLLAMQELRMNTTHPFLTHALRQQESSVLSLAADSRHIFSGSQGKDIYVRVTRLTHCVVKSSRRGYGI